ncbi:hypothetical protein Bca101_100786 [Brassica carinata]
MVSEPGSSEHGSSFHIYITSLVSSQIQAIEDLSCWFSLFKKKVYEAKEVYHGRASSLQSIKGVSQLWSKLKPFKKKAFPLFLKLVTWSCEERWSLLSCGFKKELVTLEIKLDISQGLIPMLVSYLCWSLSDVSEWAEVSPQCNGDVVEDSSIKSERDGGALHKAYHGAIMRSPSSLDLLYTRSQACGGCKDRVKSRRDLDTIWSSLGDGAKLGRRYRLARICTDLYGSVRTEVNQEMFRLNNWRRLGVGAKIGRGTDRRSVPSTVLGVVNDRLSLSCKGKAALTMYLAIFVNKVHKGSDTCHSPTTKNVKTRVLRHCISSLGHSLVYRKCSMGHYAMRGVSCETLYGDSNTLVPVSVLSLRGSLNAYDPWQEAVQSSLGEYHCLSLTKGVPGHFLASLKWL